MQFDTIVTPNYSPPKLIQSLQQTYSKQLPSFASMIRKCLKTISLFSVKQAKSQQEKLANTDQYEILTNLIDTIYSLAKIYCPFSNPTLNPSLTHSNAHPLHSQSQLNHESKQIQEQLQKQQNINRSLIKKQLQNRQQFKVIIHQLNQYKNKCNKFNEYISKLNQDIKDKDLIILHVKNLLKNCQKEKIIMFCDGGKNQGKNREKNGEKNAEKNAEKYCGWDANCKNGDILANTLQTKYGSYLSKQLGRTANGGGSALGHRRRKSQDISKRQEKNPQVKKKQKDKHKDEHKEKRKSVLLHNQRNSVFK